MPKVTPSTDTEPVYLTVPDVCSRFAIGRSRLYELLAKGELAAFKLGKRTVFSFADLTEYMSRLPAWTPQNG
jgi:excisionase family DNA binding protein